MKIKAIEILLLFLMSSIGRDYKKICTQHLQIHSLNTSDKNLVCVDIFLVTALNLYLGARFELILLFLDISLIIREYSFTALFIVTL